MKMSKQGFYAYVAIVGLSIPFTVLSQASGSAADPFDFAPDINAYVNEVAAAPPQPGALEVAQGKAIEECGMIIVNPNFTALELAAVDKEGLPNPEYRKKALQITQDRCHDFALNNSFHLRDALPLFNKAARQNNTDAIAHNLSYGLSINKLPAQRATEKALRIVTTGSPYALYVFSEALNDRGPFAATPGGEIGTMSSRLAWKLVACDRGLNCSANGPIVQSACLGEGICGPGDYRTNLQYSALKPDEYQAVAKAEANINAALANGSITTLINHR